MRIYLATAVIFFLTFLASCDDTEEENDSMPERTTHLVKITNNSGAPTCSASGTGEEITFLITYRDIQASANINDNSSGFFNVLVEDNESINVKVYRTTDDVLIADADVNVRTSSRPEIDAVREIQFCDVFELQFLNF